MCIRSHVDIDFVDIEAGCAWVDAGDAEVCIGVAAEGLAVVVFAVDAAGAAGLASASSDSASESVLDGAGVAGAFTVGTAPGVCMRLQVDMVLIDAAAGAGLVADGAKDAVELDVEVVVAEDGVAIVEGGLVVVEVAVAAVAEAGFEAAAGVDEPGELFALDEGEGTGVEGTGEVGEAVTPDVVGVVLLASAAPALLLSAASLSSSLLFLSVDL